MGTRVEGDYLNTILFGCQVDKGWTWDVNLLSTGQDLDSPTRQTLTHACERLSRFRLWG